MAINHSTISVLIEKQGKAAPKPSLKSKLSQLTELDTRKVLTPKSDFFEFFFAKSVSNY